jgi:F-type H+-transporting ATPase subunit alpha
MKQHQYSPMSVAEMAVSLYAANEGFLNDVDLNKVGSFEAALISYMNSEQSEVMAKVNESGDYNDDIAANFKSALEQFKATQTW